MIIRPIPRASKYHAIKSLWNSWMTIPQKGFCNPSLDQFFHTWKSWVNKKDKWVTWGPKDSKKSFQDVIEDHLEAPPYFQFVQLFYLFCAVATLVNPGVIDFDHASFLIWYCGILQDRHLVILRVQVTNLVTWGPTWKKGPLYNLLHEYRSIR